jgi:hypothetical protein
LNNEFYCIYILRQKGDVMKKSSMLIKSMLILLATIMIASFAAIRDADALPWIDFGSTMVWDDVNKTLTNNGPLTYVNSVTYIDGSTAIPFPFPPSDPVLGSAVTFNLSFDGNNSNDWLMITGWGGETWLDADIEILGAAPDPLSSTPNPYSMKIKTAGLVIGNGLGSQAIDELYARIDMMSPYAAGLNISWGGGATMIGNGLYTVNANGKISPVPEPGTIMLLGSGLFGVGYLVRKKKIG